MRFNILRLLQLEEQMYKKPFIHPFPKDFKEQGNQWWWNRPIQKSFWGLKRRRRKRKSVVINYSNMCGKTGESYFVKLGARSILLSLHRRFQGEQGSSQEGVGSKEVGVESNFDCSRMKCCSIEKCLFWVWEVEVDKEVKLVFSQSF